MLLILVSRTISPDFDEATMKKTDTISQAVNVNWYFRLQRLPLSLVALT